VAASDELLQAFVAAWPHAGASEPPAELDATLAALCADAHRTAPIAIDDTALVRAIARHAGPDAAAALARCRPGELAIAEAAARGDAGAIAAVEAAGADAIAATCRRFAGAGHGEDDLRQILRDRLFVSDGERPPRIAEYNGQGSLGGWLRVVATRLFIDLGRAKDRARELGGADVVEGAAAATDLALDAVKAEYRDAVALALIDAARTLEPGDRHLLRQHLVGGLTIDQLGAVLGIHRATAARRIARARDQLAERTRERLAARLALDDRELAGVFGLVLSRFDVSIGKLLASRRAAE
jgi:RNA polymerase sigma-70 factor (ECF subfamily)